jgi:hypothetical protein
MFQEARMAKKKTARKTAKRSPTRKTPATGKKRAGADAAPAIQGWPTDPMGGVPPLQLAVPDMPGAKLPTRIIAPARAPVAQVHPLGTDGFRYWTAAEALRRAAAFWTTAGARGWHRDVGASIPIRLDDGVDLNAYYARNDFPPEDIKQGLSFFHDTVRDVATGRSTVVFSGESPDVVCHELGHAVVGQLAPELPFLRGIEGGKRVVFPLQSMQAPLQKGGVGAHRLRQWQDHNLFFYSLVVCTGSADSGTSLLVSLK